MRVLGKWGDGGVRPSGREGRKQQYRIIWKGYAAAAATWEPASNISDDLLAEYHAGLDAEAELEAEEEAELEVNEHYRGCGSGRVDRAEHGGTEEQRRRGTGHRAGQA